MGAGGESSVSFAELVSRIRADPPYQKECFGGSQRIPGEHRRARKAIRGQHQGAENQKEGPAVVFNTTG